MRRFVGRVILALLVAVAPIAHADDIELRDIDTFDPSPRTRLIIATFSCFRGERPGFRNRSAKRHRQGAATRRLQVSGGLEVEALRTHSRLY